MSDVKNTIEEIDALLQRAIISSNTSVDALADRTKIPASTIKALVGEPVQVTLPSRIYLRGQVAVLARELKIDPTVTLAAFDRKHPAPLPPALDSERRLPIATVAVAAGLGGIAILAVVLAFASAF